MKNISHRFSAVMSGLFRWADRCLKASAQPTGSAGLALHGRAGATGPTPRTPPPPDHTTTPFSPVG